MSEQEKKQQRNYELFNAETKQQFLCLRYTKQIIFFTKKEQDWKKRKEGFLTAPATAIKKDPHNVNKKAR